MSHLLKRTKKTCLKFIRKLSSSKQLYIKQMEDDELSMKTAAVQHDTSSACDTKAMDVKAKPHDTDDNTQKQFSANSNSNNNETMPFSSYCWRSYDPDPDDTDNESDDGKRHRNMILENLTSKLFITANGYEFQRMQQMHTDNASDNSPKKVPQRQQQQQQHQHRQRHKQPQQQSTLQKHERRSVKRGDRAARDTSPDVYFERVKYKEHVRYFRRTPSTTSLDNNPLQSNNTNATLNAKSATPSRSTASAPPASAPPSLAPPPPPSSFSSTAATSNTSSSSSSSSTALASSSSTSTSTSTVKSDTTTATAPHHTATESNNYATYLEGSNYFLPINLSLGSKRNGNYQNVYISEERDSYNKKTPIVKWDINGNSLDDDNIFISDTWSEYDGEGNTNMTFANLYDKRCAQLKYDGSQKSNSFRSSSTTLETWLEDEYMESNADFSLRNSNEYHSNNCLMKT